MKLLGSGKVAGFAEYHTAKGSESEGGNAVEQALNAQIGAAAVVVIASISAVIGLLVGKFFLGKGNGYELIR